MDARENIHILAKDIARGKVRIIEPGKDYIPPSGKVVDGDDLALMIDSVLDVHFTEGRFAEAFVGEFTKYAGPRYCTLVNSGSSANLLALAALTSPSLKKRALKPGDEVITVACGFPTTINPIIQLGCIPVFVDVDVGTYQAKVDEVLDAINSKTKAVIIAHTLGNVFDVESIAKACKEKGIWLIEDCCDALGAEVNGKKVGNFGHMMTTSFYPAHHITMGEGGAVLTNSPALKSLLLSFRDWGRDCWCPTGKDDTCGKRFDQQFEDLPHGYDHKYVYSHMGYNLKITDMQAALGLGQLAKLPSFVEARRKNFQVLRESLLELEDELILPIEAADTRPSWFGFPLSLRTDKFERLDIVRFLESMKIGTRLIFGGNLLRHPLYKGQNYRVHRDLANTDFVMNKSFWVGVYPGLDSRHMCYIADNIRNFLRGAK